MIPQAKAVEKGIDVAIAVDMIRMGLSGEMEVAILFSSSDEDLMPLLGWLIRSAASRTARGGVAFQLGQQVEGLHGQP